MSEPLDLAELATKFVAAQLAGDRRSAVALVVASAESGVSVTDLRASVIGAAQREIGRLWQTNAISIAQEHLATGISQLALARLFDFAPPSVANGKCVFVACVQGEQHDLPARLVADYLDQAGFTVRYFGGDVPTYDLLSAIRTRTPDLLALSVTMSFNLASLRRTVVEVRAANPALPIAAGGHAITWSKGVIDDLQVATAPADPHALVELARSLTGLAPHAEAAV